VTTAGEKSATAEPAGRVERKRSRKVRDILLVAAQVLNRDGYHAMSLDEVAERMDLTKATLYHYFGSKDQLVIASLQLVAGEVNDRLQALAEGHAGEPAAVRLRELLEEQLTILLLDYPEAGRLFATPIKWPDGHRESVQGLLERHDAFFRSALEDGIANGEFITPDPNVALNCVFGALNYTPAWVRSGSRVATKRMIGTICDSVMKMLN
jgi:AcrR family transcriptional regulator